MSQTGLVVLTSPLNHVLHSVGRVLTSASHHVREVLYVHLAPGLDLSAVVPDGPDPETPPVPCNPLAKHVVNTFYTHAASHFHNLDLRLILSNIGKPNSSRHIHKLQHPYQVLLTDDLLSRDSNQPILKYATDKFVSHHSLRFQHIGELDRVESEVSVHMLEARKTYKELCLGGTFDRLHTGHKILLSEACLLCEQRVVVGIADGPVTKNKTLRELIRPCEERVASVVALLGDMKPQLEPYVVQILDPYGPAIVEPQLQCIVVSEETERGATSINDKRREKGYAALDVDMIDLVEDTQRHQGEEDKISSSSGRRRLLGTLLKDVQPKPDIPDAPYVIGLTGGIASGKSSVARRLEGLGAGVVDCDKLGHQSYLPGAPAYEPLIAEFGRDILGEDGVVDRRKLGAKVFGTGGLPRLNAITWPVIQQLATEEIKRLHAKGVSVVILDAAILLEAKWDSRAHEVWTTIIPPAEAVKRIVERNGLSEEKALERINHQMTNEERVDRANVVLCTLWEYEVTQKQVEKAWGLLQQRIPVPANI